MHKWGGRAIVSGGEEGAGVPVKEPVYAGGWKGKGGKTWTRHQGGAGTSVQAKNV